MAAKETRSCPYCLEEVAFKATRCKHCGAVLTTQPKKRHRSYLAIFFFLTSVTLGIFCWYQQGVIARQRNHINRLERQLNYDFDNRYYELDKAETSPDSMMLIPDEELDEE